MQLVENWDQFERNGLVLTIGFFDGVHIGHRFLIDQMDYIAQKESLQSAILTFWPHPRIVLDQAYKPHLLNDLPEKIELLKKLPLDYCISTAFTPALANYSAYAFMKEILLEKLHVRHLLVGYDHRFGKDREKEFEDYLQYGKELGIAVTQIQPYIENGYTTSSSFIRKLLNAGEVKPAVHYLGYPYTLTGKVVKGFQLGRTLGFPTANLKLSFALKCIPAFGSYAVRVSVKEAIYNGMLYIGNRPTIDNGKQTSIEVHLFDFNGDLYDQEISVYFIDKIRGDEKFNSIDLLKEQLHKDKETALKILPIVER